jgi:hypothetical protein
MDFRPQAIRSFGYSEAGAGVGGVSAYRRIGVSARRRIGARAKGPRSQDRGEGPYVLWGLIGRMGPRLIGKETRYRSGAIKCHVAPSPFRRYADTPSRPSALSPFRRFADNPSRAPPRIAQILLATMPARS